MTISKEEAEVLYSLAVPGQDVNQDWVKAMTGLNLDDVLHNLQQDPSIQAYIKGLLNPSDATTLAQGTYVVK